MAGCIFKYITPQNCTPNNTPACRTALETNFLKSKSSRTSPGTVRKPCLERRRPINIWCDRKQRDKPFVGKQTAVYASRRALPHAMQDPLPAGGLRLCRAGVEPAGSLREVSAHVILLSRASPGAITVRSNRGCPIVGRQGTTAVLANEAAVIAHVRRGPADSTASPDRYPVSAAISFSGQSRPAQSRAFARARPARPNHSYLLANVPSCREGPEGRRK